MIAMAFEPDLLIAEAKNYDSYGKPDLLIALLTPRLGSTTRFNR